jgi:hypothetical protein
MKSSHVYGCIIIEASLAPILIQVSQCGSQEIADSPYLSFMFRREVVLWMLGLGGAVLLLGECTRRSGAVEIDFLNLHDSVAYVGMQTCRSCHGNVHDTYIHTGMGMSFGRATPGRSGAAFGDHALVYDSVLNFYYFPWFADSTLFIREFRLENGDTVHNRVETVHFIIGSGHHTNSHILWRNGYLYQAPITYYTQDGKWDLAPGYELGENLRFSRILNTECITCHNHLPGHVAGSENKYFAMPEGIECERCHGPGELHVAAKLAGERVDTSRHADRTIVNPRRLSRDKATDLCQRCHLQGVAVLKPGKTFFDFRPGMALAEVMQVFLPRFSDSDERFIMASQADRLRMSACYLRSDELTCTTCHNPHQSVRFIGVGKYNDACRHCHTRQTCTVAPAQLQAYEENCVGCHMPRSGSIDIPHVRITDHYIRRDYTTRQVPGSQGQAQFLGLEPLLGVKTSAVEMAEGYIALFDKFIPDPVMLDSAAMWLARAQEGEERLFPVRVHLAFARGETDALNRLADTRDTTGLDAWTAYRLGEACANAGRHRKSLAFLRRAVHEAPYNLQFQEKYGVAVARSGDLKAASRIFRFILSEDPARPLPLTNLGYIHALEGEYEAAERYYRQALALDPDHAQAAENLKALREALSKRAGRR